MIVKLKNNWRWIKYRIGLFGFVLFLLFFTIQPEMGYGHVSHVLNSEHYNTIKLSYIGIEVTATAIIGLSVFSAILIQSFQHHRNQNKISRIFNKPSQKSVDFALFLLRILSGLYLMSSAILGGFLNVTTPLNPEIAYFEIYMTLEIITGIILLTGLSARIGAIMMFGLYVSSFGLYGLYSFDLIMIPGICIALFLKGGSKYSLSNFVEKKNKIEMWIDRKLKKYEFLSFPSLRLGFGATLIWLGLTEKILAPGMFAAVMEKYHFDPIGGDPSITIVGAGLIEIIIGIFYLLGLQLRIISILLLGLFVFTMFTFEEGLIAHTFGFAIAIVFVVIGNKSGISKNKKL